MDAKELREKTPDQLRDELENMKKEAFNLRFQQATNQLENTARMRSVRRDAARVKTILNEKAASAAAEANESTDDGAPPAHGWIVGARDLRLQSSALPADNDFEVTVETTGDAPPLRNSRFEVRIAGDLVAAGNFSTFRSP